MATKTVAAAGEVPGLRASSRGGLIVFDLKGLIGARVFHQEGVGLIGIPAKGVTSPDTAVEVEDLGFEAAPAGRGAVFHFQCESFRQNGILWETPLSRGVDLIGSGDGEPSFR